VSLRDAATRAFAAIGAAGLWGLFAAGRWTIRVRVAGERPRGPAIYCYWHGDAFVGFMYLFGLPPPMIAMAHPSLAARPYHTLGRWLGWQVIVGSAGHGGRAAADALIAALRAGGSTFVCPDGPAGPARTLKRGVLHIARAAGVPIVPVRFTCSAAVRLPRWDGWRMPLPGSTVAVELLPAISVGDDVEACVRALTAALNGAE
jgi:lysophospholipid acyltransferase (LPLAT)-like uncharacterized protein